MNLAFFKFLITLISLDHHACRYILECSCGRAPWTQYFSFQILAEPTINKGTHIRIQIYSYKLACFCRNVATNTLLQRGYGALGSCLRPCRAGATPWHLFYKIVDGNCLDNGTALKEFLRRPKGSPSSGLQVPSSRLRVPSSIL